MKRVTILQGNNLDRLRELADNSVDSIVTDPPYGLGKEPDPVQLLRAWLDHGYLEIQGKGFNGKAWDAFVPQPELWKEVLRVLKPGGYVVAFFGTRTYDWGVLALRLAGFEIRDQLAWVYGSGFPKNLDVARAIDAADAPGKQRARQLQFTAWMRSKGITAAQINQATGTSMGGHYLTDKEQPAIATREHLENLRPILGDIPDWVEKMADERSAGSDNLKKRKPVNVRVQDATIMQNIGTDSTPTWYIETAAHTDQAKAYEGWGTAIKPAQEPIVLARKPFKGTVAENVLQHGTGAINIDGCRIATAESWSQSGESSGGPALNAFGDGLNNKGRSGSDPLGRYPANIIHDGSDQVLRLFGEAARFYYCAKASKKDRDEGLQALRINNAHPTVKPTALMAYLCRLVTPKGGTILDPFAGSGTTGKAAVLEGFNVVLMEREAEYIPLIEARTAWAEEVYKRSDNGPRFSALELALLLDNEEEVA